MTATTFCRSSSWYVSERVGSRVSQPFKVPDDPPIPPSVTVQRFVTLRAGSIPAVLVQREEFGSASIYELFTTAGTTVSPVRLLPGGSPVLLLKASSLLQGAGFTCTASASGEVIDQYEWSIINPTTMQTTAQGNILGDPEAYLETTVYTPSRRTHLRAPPTPSSRSATRRSRISATTPVDARRRSRHSIDLQDSVLNRFIASATPIVAMASTASAASSTAAPRISRSAEPGRRSTWSAPMRLPGGLPIPIRTRTYPGSWRCAWIDLSPLWPAVPPPCFHLHTADGQVELVVHDDETRQILDPVAAHERTDGEARVVHVGQRERDRHPATLDAQVRGASVSSSAPCGTARLFWRRGASPCPRPRCGGCARTPLQGYRARRRASRPQVTTSTDVRTEPGVPAKARGRAYDSSEADPSEVAPPA